MSGIKHNRRHFLAEALLVGLIAAGVILPAAAGWLWKGGMFLPGWIAWQTRPRAEAAEMYSFSLSRRQVQVFDQNGLLWASPKELLVQDALSCDIDNDGREELLLLCWKRGRYGKERPFWVQEEERGWSQHLFVYTYEPDGPRPKWMSSYMGQDVQYIRENEKDGAQKRLWLTEPSGQTYSWRWDAWGFVQEESQFSFVAFGDLIAHEPVYRYGLKQGFDGLFAGFSEILEQADVAVINQETPLTNRPGAYRDYPRFATPAQLGEAIARAGFDVVTCATNHMLDQQAAGADFTRDFLEKQGLRCLGITGKVRETVNPSGNKNQPGNAGRQPGKKQPDRAYLQRGLWLEKQGLSVAMFNYTYGTNGILPPEDRKDLIPLLTEKEEEKIRQELSAARKEADMVMVFVHWGTEGAKWPDALQRKWTQLFLEEQVDVVIGTHPHELQPVELVISEDGHEMLVYYSLGNFVSAQPQKSCTRGGMATFWIGLTQEGYRITDYALTPLVIERQPDGGYIPRIK